MNTSNRSGLSCYSLLSSSSHSSFVSILTFVLVDQAYLTYVLENTEVINDQLCEIRCTLFEAIQPSMSECVTKISRKLRQIDPVSLGFLNLWVLLPYSFIFQGNFCLIVWKFKQLVV